MPPETLTPLLGRRGGRYGNGDLAHALRHEIRGDVRFDDGSRALYATDASNYRRMPLGVVLPRDADDVFRTVSLCRQAGVPILNRGGGTSLAGQTANTAVVLDFSRHMHHVLAIDPSRRIARVQPGVILDDLRNAAEEHGLTFGPDPATHNRCTLGGMIGNNSCGVHSVMAGCTADNVLSLDVLTYDGERLRVGPTSEARFDRMIASGGRTGEIYSALRSFRDRHAEAIRRGFPDIPRRVSGYNLPALLPENGCNVAAALVGSEGTLATVLEATVCLVHSPPRRVLVVLGYPSIFEAADHVTEVLEAGPIGLEGLDDVLVDNMKRKNLHPEGVKILPDGSGWLLVEFGDETVEGATAKAERLMESLRRSGNAPSMKLLDSREDEAIVWTVRESGLGATARVPGEPDTWPGWEDAAVPPRRLGAYLREFHDLLNRYGYHASLYGHFGQGCVHTRIPFDLRHGEGVGAFHSFVEEAADLVVRYGGSLSGEHGDGQARAELLPRMFPPALMKAFGEFKAIWDPLGGMNPGIVVNPIPQDEDLRVGPDFSPADLVTWFSFRDDAGSFARATERCVGVGECRRLDHGTMCPSYMVTREERHSTRGRAHLLFEMLRGGVSGRWRNESVHEALDLCLSCKGCKSECPVNVDMATYKAEFLAHYYKGRLRPRAAYVFGLIHRWARIGSFMPGLANLMTQAPGLSRLARWAGNIAPGREMPRLASRTFMSQWRSRSRTSRVDTGRKRVILWPDTFNNHFQPDVLSSAAAVLEEAGCRVEVPRQWLCCGRPLYDYGMLDLARKLLREIVDALAPDVDAGAHVVGVEPSCIAVFRDELVNLLPDDERAARLAQSTLMLDEYLASEAAGWTPPRIGGSAIVQGHCHQKAVLTLDRELTLLGRAGIEAQELDAGCCGMAGGFGYETSHYDVSVACAERRLLPAVRGAPGDTIIVADGFSCREQIRQQTGREALHFAQVMDRGVAANGTVSARAR